MVRYYQQIEFTEKFNLKSNARRDSNECCIKLTKISAKVEEKGIIYTRKCKYEG